MLNRTLKRRNCQGITREISLTVIPFSFILLFVIHLTDGANRFQILPRTFPTKGHSVR